MPQITISDSAFLFLQSRAVPLIDTASSALDALIEEFKSLSQSTKTASTEGLIFDLESVPSVKFTSIISAEIDGKPASQTFWNNILEDVIRACIAKGATAEAVINRMSANTRHGLWSEGGYRPVAEAGMSFQGLEANRACRNIVSLARAFQIGLSITIRWQDNEEAALPNQKGKIVFP